MTEVHVTYPPTPDDEFQQLRALYEAAVARIVGMEREWSATVRATREAMQERDAALQALSELCESYGGGEPHTQETCIAHIGKTLDRYRADRADALNVRSRDGLLSSEWVARTGKAERERNAALAELANARAALSEEERDAHPTLADAIHCLRHEITALQQSSKVMAAEARIERDAALVLLRPQERHVPHKEKP